MAITRKMMELMGADELRASDAASSGAILLLCAACGESEGAVGDFERCACHTVVYCGVECQANHRKAHKRDCKNAMKKRKKAKARKKGRR